MFKAASDIQGAENPVVPEWMTRALEANGTGRYLYWGNHDDIMAEGDGWCEPQELSSPSELWRLDELNELVNFYFVVYRDEKLCPDCDGDGYNDATRKLVDTWYSHRNPEGSSWEYMLTQDEVQALFDAGRIPEDECPDAVEYNSRHVFHDAINEHICVKARATRLGFYGLCPTCDGDGSVYIDDEWRLGLQMWFLHPRKGASRGVFCTDITEDELDGVFEYLMQARERMANVFAGLPL